MRKLTCLLFPFFCIMIFASCSMQKKITKEAKQDILTNPDFATAHVGITIYDPSTQQYLYNYQGDKFFVPASNTKLFACYAAMKNLGDSLIGIRYEIVDDKTVEIDPTGDPSFLHPDFKTQPVFSFLKKFQNIKIANPLYTGEFMGSGWAWNDFMEGYMAQRNNLPVYGNVVRVSKKSDTSITMIPSRVFKNAVMEPLKTGFESVKSWDQNVFVFMSGTDKNKEIPFRPDIVTVEALMADTLHRKVESDFFWKGPLTKVIHSQPTDSLLKIMMHRSDNFFAEQTLLMIGKEKIGVMKDKDIIDTLLKTDFAGLPQKPRWVDGSGLSRYNLFTPQDFVWVLTQMKNEFKWERIQEILPTGGEGTLSSYYKNYAGKIYAKTGSLSNHLALSGYITTKKGKQLIFSVLVNAEMSPAANIRKGVEKFLTGLMEKY